MPKFCSAQLALFDGDAPPAAAAVRGRRSNGRGQRKFRQGRGLSACVLGSGSGGNATVVRFGTRGLLIDAGLGPRTTAARLARASLTLSDLHAVCLTHLDTDHFRKTWVNVLRDLAIPLHLHRWHLPELSRVQGGQTLIDAGLVRAFEDAGFAPFDDDAVAARVLRLQHDRQGTIGYRFDFAGGARGSLGYATDLGHVPEALLDRFAGVDVLCLEANYDEHMTMNSPRPSFVNRRNLSDSGHLSNEQAFAAVREIDARSPHRCPRHIVLMHRSSQCNHPTKLRRVFEAAPSIMRRVTLAEQRTRTRWLHAQPRPATIRHQYTLHQRTHATV
jgi:phosphoribosyl 1,2-cyclic phosphodiesterase